MVLGVAGVVTDGRLRDTPEIETLDFPVGCAGRAAPTSLVRHHAMDINVPIGCSEVAVYSGDIIVGDGKGVAVILRHLADDAALGYEQALLVLCFQRMTHAAPRPSLPGLTRQSILPKDVDARDFARA